MVLIHFVARLGDMPHCWRIQQTSGGKRPFQLHSLPFLIHRDIALLRSPEICCSCAHRDHAGSSPRVHVHVAPLWSSSNILVRNHSQSACSSPSLHRARREEWIWCTSCSRPSKLAGHRHRCSTCALVSASAPHLHLPSPRLKVVAAYAFVRCLSHRSFMFAALRDGLRIRAFHWSYVRQSMLAPSPHQPGRWDCRYCSE